MPLTGTQAQRKRKGEHGDARKKRRKGKKGKKAKRAAPVVDAGPTAKKAKLSTDNECGLCWDSIKEGQPVFRTAANQHQVCGSALKAASEYAERKGVVLNKYKN